VAACGGAAPPPVANSTPKPAPPAPSNDVADKLVHGHPTTADFDALVEQFPSLSAARRSAIAALGTTNKAPIHVPTIQYEYVWVEKIACNGGTGRVNTQALTGDLFGKMLDLLSFNCPDDATEHAAYFDYSDDPQEQQMQRELGSGH
ncbi:MAG TPA: hypothetical protein VGG28_20470, partial [Kofleriaceae bacterium]|jgi:hypothetical protein